MDSSEHVEHSKIKKFQTWNMHKLATVKFSQITILDLIWIIKTILVHFNVSCSSGAHNKL
jgi:hypothetical protein